MSPYPKGYLLASDVPPLSEPQTWTGAHSTATFKSPPGRHVLVAKFSKLMFASTSKTGLA